MTQPQRGRGRPKSASPRETLTLRLSPEERALLERVAEQDGEPLATWARETLLAMAREGEEARERLRRREAKRGL